MSISDPVTIAKALADETRQRIIGLRCCRWLPAGKIAERTGLTQPTVSRHLAVLRGAGLVHVRNLGKRSFYSLDQDREVSCCGQWMVESASEQEDTAGLQQAGD